ncbi:MAG: hypothetical protein M3283_04405 [Actinomycetota bacterium]|nr:hypothetical protein [Actinomycetota bacterium]
MDESTQRSEPTTHSHLMAIPLALLSEDVADRVGQAGAPGVNLYRALTHAPRLLRA